MRKRPKPQITLRVKVGIRKQSLRDYFAASAFHGIVLANLTNAPDAQIAAEAAYRLADAMLAARKKRNDGH